MSIENFFTLQTLFPAAPATGGAKATSSPEHTQSANFIDLILARVLENMQKSLEEQKKLNGPLPVQTEEKSPLQSANILLDKSPGLDLAELIAANPEIEQDVKDFITTPSGDLTLTPEQQIVQALMMNQRALDDTLKPLTNGIITAEQVQKGSPRLMQALLIDTEKSRKDVLNTLQSILNKLEKLTQDKTGAGLAITNLTPEQITQLKAKIEALLAKSETSQVADSGAAVVELDADDGGKEIATCSLGLISITPPPSQPEVIVLPRGLVITPRPLEVTQQAAAKTTPFSGYAPANDLSAKLNPLTPVAETPAIPGEAIPKGEDFSALLKEFANKKPGAELQIAQGSNVKAPTPGVTADAGILLNWPLASDGLMIAYPQSYDSMPASVTSPAMITSPVTQASFAGSAHPATQMVAIAMQKSAADAQNKSFILQMDPPELGRLEVRLSFGKDKSVKGVVLAERSETLSMLQRDAHVLERALQNAGLDTNGSLSFELANDGHFDQDGGHDGSRGGHGGNAQEDTEIIQSTMNWYVDENTGLMRFNILA